MPSAKVTCPGCRGEKTKEARLCSSCRSFAIEIGVEAVLARGRRAGQPRDAKELEQHDKFRRAYNGKAQDIANALGETKLSVKQGILARASQHFGRPIASFDDTSLLEGGWILDRLEDQLDALELAGERDVD